MSCLDWWQRFKRALRLQYLRILRQPGSTHSIAMGMAAGIFVGFLPIIPFQSVVAIALAFLVRGSKVVAVAGTWISNPVNVIPFYGMLYWVGHHVWHTDIVFDPAKLELAQMLQQGAELVAVMTIGGVILGIPAAFVAYVLTFKGVNAYRQRRMIKLLRQHVETRNGGGDAA